ncbi:ABC transporter substrate-binding protein [Lacticaseibacillus chiayiensis]|uniref:ABC transporter substrate-binding protein n=1 Tax=Lacticaseibacillus chiayiensis TaxID=2100821 RepID=A0A4Q1TV87_9LACO|nr:ABC transporter substrate-binding protein [Lacticaseibacillus chiayiensis]
MGTRGTAVSRVSYALKVKDPPLDFLIRVVGPFTFSRERKSHMDEFVHVAVDCK